MANINERDSKVHVTITHKREKKKPKYSFSVVMSGLLITSTLLASFSGLTAHAAGLDTDYASKISNPTPIVATYQKEYSSKVTSLLNTSYEEILLISSKLGNDNATLKALLSINGKLNDANETMDTENYKPTEVIAMATMINTALDGVDTSLSQAGYNSNSSQRVIVAQMKTTISEINAKAGGKLSQSSQTPSVKPLSFSDFNWNNSPMKFSDVPQGAWYFSDVSKASASGIINGIGNNKFNPDGTLTHAEAMTLMAKVHAIYNGKVDELNSYMANSSGKHWADGVYDYCKANGLSGAINKSKFDEKISRGTMATYFRKALPTAAYTSGHQNDISLAPETPPSSDVRDLFKAGIMVGDDNGFRFYDSITRAEAAAIIHRVANPNVRVKVEAPEQPSTPVTPPVTNPGGGSTTQPGQVQSSKPYKNIPHTNWQSDPTGGVSISSQSGYINTKYGNHTYGCANQQEYDKVMSVMDEAFNYAVQQEANNNPRGGFDSYAKEGTERTIFFQQQLGITNKQQIISMRVTEDFVYNMKIYLTNTYAKPNGTGTNTDKHNNNVYKYLFAGGHLDCDGSGSLNMLCWDYLGFSTRMISSNNVKHAAAQVYVNGQWVMLEQGAGTFDDMCTHKQLLELMSGKSNAAYSTHSDTDAIIRAASSSPERLSDLFIEANETPTHNPSDRSVK